MNAREVGFFSIYTGVLVVLILATFAILQWLGMPAGRFLDWVIGAASFWWLSVIVTVPWNIYFMARKVLAEAAPSQKLQITTSQERLHAVNRIARHSLWMAIALHLVSATGLFLLAAFRVSAIGYLASAAALLLTGLRPAIAFYRYLSQWLTRVEREVKYPREDVVELRNRVGQLETSNQHLSQQLDLGNPTSLMAQQQRKLEALRQDLTTLASAHESLKSLNHSEHDRLSREAREAIARVSADAQFLDRVRELIRFWKQA